MKSHQCFLLVAFSHFGGVIVRFQKHSNYWAVYDNNDNLVCLTVYKKGAREVVNRLSGESNYSSEKSALMSNEIIRLGNEVKNLNKRFNLLLKAVQTVESLPNKVI